MQFKALDVFNPIPFFNNWPSSISTGTVPFLPEMAVPQNGMADISNLVSLTKTPVSFSIPPTENKTLEDLLQIFVLTGVIVVGGLIILNLFVEWNEERKRKAMNNGYPY